MSNIIFGTGSGRFIDSEKEVEEKMNAHQRGEYSE